MAYLAGSLLICEASLADFPAWAGHSGPSRHDGFGATYEELGAFDYQNAGKNSEERAKQAAKEGQLSQDRAKSYGLMGDQIGKDYSSLIPQLQQARQQDSQNKSTSSRLNSLLAAPYLPPDPYRKPFQQLGLKLNQNLYREGPPIRTRLYEEAKRLQERSVKLLADASSAMAAKNQFGSLRDVTSARGQRMGAIEGPGKERAPKSLPSRQSASKTLASSSKGAYGTEGMSDKIAASDITSRKNSDLGGAAPGRSLGRPSLLAEDTGAVEWENAATQPREAKHSKEAENSGNQTRKRESQEGFSVLDSLFPEIMDIASGKVPASDAHSDSSPGVTVSQESESMQVLAAFLGAPSDASQDPANSGAGEKNAHQGHATFQSSDFLLEEESLFARIRSTLSRAGKSGRIGRLGN